MVRVGEDQGILTLKHVKTHFRSISRTIKGHHYGAELSFHRSASESIPALVLVRA
jgi:hypothetical protein